jgi:hypothetical protein
MMTSGASADPMVALAVKASQVERHLDALPEATADATTLPDVELAPQWRGLTKGCSYLAPKGDLARPDGTVDVVFHFHAGQMSERQLRESKVRAVFVACGYGIGSGAYASAFADPGTFGWMADALLRDLRAQSRRHDLTLGHVALASWSAGFGAVGKILAVDRYYDLVDTVILLDSLHSQYVGAAKKPAQGAEQVDLKMMGSFVKFARDAAAGKKAMFVSHSSIIPPDYASSAEATAALLGAIGVPPRDREETNARGMTAYYRADAGNLHVQGFRGRGPRDHFAHLHLIGEALRSSVVPRWKR